MEGVVVSALVLILAWTMYQGDFSFAGNVMAVLGILGIYKLITEY